MAFSTNIFREPNQTFCYTRWNTPKSVTSLRSPSPRHCAWATELPSKKYRSSSQPLAALNSIGRDRDLNLRPPAPTTNALPLEQLFFYFLLLVNNATTIIIRKQRWSRGHKARGQERKKIWGQGQPFRGQTLSRPTTGMLDAQAKDQGHRRKCSLKKGLQNFFFRRSPKDENKKGLRKFSARFLAFSYIILKMNKSLLL